MAMRVVGDSEAVDEDQAVVALDDADEGSEGDDDEEDDEDVGGGTDDEVPGGVIGVVDGAGGENYFGRAATEGAAPVGANPFAAPPSAAAGEDDWATQIADAKRQVAEQRVKREREEAADREREEAAAEMSGKRFEARRKAGDPAPERQGAAGTGRRKIVKARRTWGGSGGGTSSTGATPSAFGGTGIGGAPVPSPFAGFSLLATPTPPAPALTSTPQGGAVLSRLSGGTFSPGFASLPSDRAKASSPPPAAAAATAATTSAAAMAAPSLFGGFGGSPSTTAAPPSLFASLDAPVKPVVATAAASAAASAAAPAATDSGGGVKFERVKTALALELGL
eukprot:CAMPEP_0181390612 /NCGR_PEP_ID=MMETSP1106-20121128/25581_1 /TAXON_ID=81844 /ORGANISM="Mantoniella antarctica, Strain SL-175" /LENGTH=336 /DNA_ID=CAMNT_0023511541 /DNA_START=306 /DNA_END=1317 /DNA_ORIENTATION=+